MSPSDRFMTLTCGPGFTLTMRAASKKYPQNRVRHLLLPDMTQDFNVEDYDLMLASVGQVVATRTS